MGGSKEAARQVCLHVLPSKVRTWYGSCGREVRWEAVEALISYTSAKCYACRRQQLCLAACHISDKLLLTCIFVVVRRQRICVAGHMVHAGNFWAWKVTFGHGSYLCELFFRC